MTDMERPRVGVVGAGIMGTAISTRLLDCGLAVRVFDLDPAKVAALEAKGAIAAASAQSVAAGSDVVILSLNSAAIVRQAVFGPDGVATAVSAETLVVDMSSIDPAATVDIAAKLRAATGAGWVDAPLSGGAPAALKGALTVMAGGTAEDVARARRVMDHLCANYTHMGPNGAGQTTKLINQLLCAFAFQAVAEAVKLAEAGGVDASRIPAALSGGRADGRILQEFMAKFARRDMTPTGRIDNMLKDLEAVQAFAAPGRVPLPVTGLITELHRLMVAAGIGPEDSAAIMKFYDGQGAGTSP
jgi:2-hydroxy-3-oxopropionate reductase